MYAEAEGSVRDWQAVKPMAGPLPFGWKREAVGTARGDEFNSLA